MGKPIDTVTDIDIDAELAKFEVEERARLGLDQATEHWTDNMTAPVFTASQRAQTTLLVGGLTAAHNELIEAALMGIGYKSRALESPDQEALRHGKEFGNRGQCNPTYFTVGGLVKELCRLRDEEGLTSQEVIDRYAFVTAGACGPCRFGMYVTEYRKAIRDAGFDGFRVLLFEQTGGISQATGEELGLVLNPTFFAALARALFGGDVINLLAYRIRPYELEEGATDRAMTLVKKEVADALVARKSVLLAMRRARKFFEAVDVDRTLAKPKVHILGEFWAMVTEGEGNYHLQRFLEAEGAECDIQILSNVLLYNLWEFRNDTTARRDLRGADDSKFGLAESDYGVAIAGLWLGEMALRSIIYSMAFCLGLRDYHLPDMDAVAAEADGFYNRELRGGEGHLEVGKLILNVVKNKTHMTLSVKPFGCMPSSGVSDGVQSIVTELYPDAIFCPVETNGDGAVNFYSRVQMYLFKARLRAGEEYSEALAEYGVTREEVQGFVSGTEYGTPLYKAPHVAAGSAADLVHEVGPLIHASRLGRLRIRAERAVRRAHTYATKTAPAKARRYGQILPHLPALARLAAVSAKDAIPAPQGAWNELIARAVRPSEEQQRQIDAAEAAASVPKVVDSPPGLPIMA